MSNEYIKVFKAFSDSHRVRILEILCQNEQCACVLLDDLQISQPTLSHHMKILCESGIVKSRSEGKWNYYSINEDGCEYASKLIQNVKEKHMNNIIKIMSDFFQKLNKTKSVLGLHVDAVNDKSIEKCSCSCEK